MPPRVGSALLLSLLAHALLLSMALGGQRFGMPGLSFPWKERRLGADDLRITLAPAPVPTPPAAAPGVIAPADRVPSLDTPAIPRLAAPPAVPRVPVPTVVPQAAVSPGVDVAPPIAKAPAPDMVQADAEQARIVRDRLAENSRREEAARQESERITSLRQDSLRREALQNDKLAREEKDRQEAARQDQEAAAARRQEALQQEAARQEVAKQELLKQELAKQDLVKQQLARQEQARQEQAKQEQAKQEQAKQEQAKQELARQEQLKQDQLKQAQAKQDLARTERAEQEAQREERLRAIGRQLNAEAAQRDGPPDSATRSLLPGVSNLRRGLLLGRADANAELVRYAETMGQKIELNMTFDMVRAQLQQPHATPVVTVAVRADGTVEKVTFVVSSGVPALDAAIRRVIASQAPYGAFPPALARQYDVVEIRRSWMFDTAIRLQ
jgi:hypothetical protein